jgi:hypothetical protein
VGEAGGDVDVGVTGVLCADAGAEREGVGESVACMGVGVTGIGVTGGCMGVGVTGIGVTRRLAAYAGVAGEGCSLSSLNGTCDD